MHHILVVGGEPAVSQLVRSALQQDGRYRVMQASSSKEARLLLGHGRPSLAIIDSSLPDMTGIELAERARREDVPVLLLTDRPGAERAGHGFATLSKPIVLGDLLQRSRALIAEAKQQHHLLRQSLRRLKAGCDGVYGALKQMSGTIAQINGERGDTRRGDKPSYDFRRDPILRDALAYWREKRGMRAMPMRRDIDPSELPKHFLPHLQLIDVVDGGERFHFRLVGTAIVDAFGAEFTGKHADEVIKAERIADLHRYYRTVIEAQRPVLIRSRYLTTKAVDMTANRLLLPLSQDGAQVNMILGALTFELMGAGATERGAPLDEITTCLDVA